MHEWWTLLHAGLLLSATGLAVWAAISAFARRNVPGRLAFGWLQLSIAFWCAMSGLQAIVVPTAERLLFAKAQYLGTATTPALWLLFAGAYTRRMNGRLTAVLWLSPAALTILAVFTNDWHQLYWSRIVENGAQPLVYVHGPAFWAAAVYAYVCLAYGTYWLVSAQRHYPKRYRPQTRLLLGALVAPWIGNFTYLTGILHVPGLDLTPVGFTVTGVCFAVGVFRYELFELVPLARGLLFDNLGDAVFVLDRGLHVLDMNAAARTLAGPGSTVGRPIQQTLTWWPRLNLADQSGTAQPVTLNVDPANRWLEVSVTPVYDAGDRQQRTGAFVAWLVVVRDVSERLRAHAERLALERRLLEQQHVESLSVLTGGLAHDFNNFLQGILGSAEIALRQLKTREDPRESLDAVIVGSERAIEIVEKMRAYAGERPQAFVRVDLDSLVHGMVGLLQRSAARHGTISYEAPATPVRVLGDPTQLRQVVLNLIVNAAEASGNAPCAITVRTGVELVTADRLDASGASAPAAPGRYAVLEVRDGGPGMSPAVLARIFDPFFTTKTAGRGLGLAALQGIVRNHEGAVRAASEPGRSTTFTVWFPLAEIQAGERR